MKEPICWKCTNKICEDNEDGAMKLVGCKAEAKIKCYEDAKELCPLIQ
jgi:hypothetical protein